MASIKSISIKLSDGSWGSWTDYGGNKCYSPPGPMQILNLKDCLQKNNLWNAIASLTGGTNDLQAIIYWMTAFAAVSIIGLLFHGFFIWLIAMVKPS
mgnify:CR=1 FL=1